MNKISKTKLKSIRKLLLKKERDKNKQFLVKDLFLINEAKKLGLLVEAYETDDGVIGVVNFPKELPLGNQIIYLDEITDPSNLGKIIYLMKQYKIKDLLLSPNSVSPYNEKCLDIAKKDIFAVNIVHGDLNTLKKLKATHQIIATGLKSTCYLNEVKLKDKFVLIFGNEARGVSPSALNLAHQVVKIPIKNIDSLNVSVAASIILHHLK